MNKCLGCGKTLQNTDKNKDGYVPNLDKEVIYCQRCFRLKHYGESKKLKTPKTDSEIINYVNKHAKEVFFITDFININENVIKLYKKINVKKSLIVNKSDIIPKNISLEQIKKYISTIFKITDDIIFTNKKSNLNNLVKKLYKKEVYFLGSSNSGKSTIINKLLILDGKNKILSESFKENTTQEFMKINFKNFCIYDSPGFYVGAYELNKLTNINDEIKPISYRINTYSVFSINDKIKLMISGKTNVVFYFSKNVKINRNKKKIDGSIINIPSNSDLVILGLGFIKFTNAASIYIDDSLKEYIIVRKSITGGKFKGE